MPTAAMHDPECPLVARKSGLHHEWMIDPEGTLKGALSPFFAYRGIICAKEGRVIAND